MSHFVVEHVVGAARGGVVSAGGKQLRTPACMLFTRNGITPHMIPSMVAPLQHQSLAQAPLEASYANCVSFLVRD